MRTALLVVLGSVACATAELRAAVPFCGNCEYLVRNRVGAYPPDGPERGRWNCYDQKTSISINCSFVRVDNITKYDDVFRREEVAREPSTGLPGLIIVDPRSRDAR